MNEATQSSMLQSQASYKVKKAMLEFDSASEIAKEDILFLVRYYYAIQDDRKRSASQLKEALARREKNELLLYLAQQQTVGFI